MSDGGDCRTATATPGAWTPMAAASAGGRHLGLRRCSRQMAVVITVREGRHFAEPSSHAWGVYQYQWWSYQRIGLLPTRIPIFKASALWSDAFFKSKCPYVCVCVCVFVCLCVCSLLRYRLTVFLPPLPEVGCPIFLEIRNPWGKVIERNGLTFEHFCLEVV